jgi:small multidrug resistance pump
MHWYFLAAAIAFEVAGTTSMKLSDGFANLAPSLLMFAFYAAAFFCNTMALRRLDLSITYSIWCGMGTALVAIIGMTAFRETVTLLKLGSIALILVGVVGLGLSARTA